MRHPITYATNPNDTCEWLQHRGYRAAPCGVPGCYFVGVLFSRGDEPARLAVLGETLVFHDGQVRVEES